MDNNYGRSRVTVLGTQRPEEVLGETRKGYEQTGPGRYRVGERDVVNVFGAKDAHDRLSNVLRDEDVAEVEVLGFVYGHEYDIGETVEPGRVIAADGVTEVYAEECPEFVPDPSRYRNSVTYVGGLHASVPGVEDWPEDIRRRGRGDAMQDERPIDSVEMEYAAVLDEAEQAGVPCSGTFVVVDNATTRAEEGFPDAVGELADILDTR